MEFLCVRKGHAATAFCYLRLLILGCFAARPTNRGGECLTSGCCEMARMRCAAPIDARARVLRVAVLAFLLLACPSLVLAA